MKKVFLLSALLAFFFANTQASIVTFAHVSDSLPDAIPYYIGVSSNPTNGGTTTGAGEYYNGQPCTLTASANSGFIFTNWTENDVPQSSNPVYTFTVTQNRNLVANFVASTYTISAYADPYIGGSVVGAGTYGYQETCTLTATANPGYDFVCWTENGANVSNNRTYSFMVTADRNLVATFVQQTYVISTTVNPTNGGSASGAGTYTYNQTCTLTTVPETGYYFMYWSENGEPVSNNATYSFQVTASRNLVAEFARQTYIISATVNPTEAGSVTGTGSYIFESTCTLTATPNVGFTFVCWTENGDPVSNEPTYEFSVTGNRNLVANFTVASYQISVTVNPTIGGTVNGAGTYLHGQLCTLTAIANPHYTFQNWSDENGQVVSNTPTYSFNVAGPRNLVANFASEIYTVTVAAEPEVGGVVDGGDDYYYGQECTVTAEANTGYHFVNWTENGIIVATNSTYQFTVTANRHLVANFDRNQYEVYGGAGEGGEVIGAGPYYYGDTCNLIAVPYDCYAFVGWFENGVLVSTEPEYSFVVEGNHNFMAEFQPIQYQLSIAVNDTTMGQAYAEIDGTTYHSCDTCMIAVYCGDSCTIAAIPSQHYYSFENWIDENGEVFSTEAVYTFVMDQNYHLTAVFSKNVYLIAPEIYPEGAGEVSGDIGYHFYGDTVTICAHANENYYFEHWIINDTLFVEDTCYTFVVYGEDYIIAGFYYDDAVSESLSSTIALYPNPAYDAVTIEGEDINRVRVYNVYGQMMGMIETRKQSSIRLEIGNYASGTYILMLDTDQGTAVKRFVKQ